jgi:hypothetical protein
MEFITGLQEALVKTVGEVIRASQGQVKAESLSAMEQAVQQMNQMVGSEVMRQWLEAQDEKYPADRRACECGEQAVYVRRREGMSITLQGRVYYRRAYYLCPACGQGHYPVDEQLGIRPGEMSEQVIKQAALLGVQDAFGSARETLKTLTLLELSHSSIQKASLMMGQSVVAREAALMERSQDFDHQLQQRRQQEKPARLYGSLDGFMVPLDDGWHEMKAGTWWTTTQRRDGTLAAQNIRYYVDLLPADAFADLVWATGFEQQADQAHELIFVADGARWIWDIVERLFPHAIQIVDWYHACRYLTLVAQATLALEREQVAWRETMTTALWQGQVDIVIAACQALIRSERADDPAQQAVTYYTNNCQRMDYPTYRQHGYMIGSGSMESGCKQLGFERLKIAGAHWSADGARNVAKARAALLSETWSELTPVYPALPRAA